MKVTNSKGITLISLIVTIIVLMIIAGISIATLTADNGVLRQTNSAKVTQIEGTSREQVDLACAAMRLAIAQASAQDNSYSAKANAAAIQSKLLEVIKADSKMLESGKWSAGTLNAEEGSFEITYAGDDYKNACNDTNASIKYTIGLSQKSIEVIGEENSTLKDQNGDNVVINIGNKTETIYLVDKAEIGNYVDLGNSLDYSNKAAFTSGYTTALSADELKGWRVLSKSGSGSSGTVTLVSSGVPLAFHHPGSGVSDSSLEILNNINTEITIVENGIQGFYSNGFSSPNLASIWASNDRINVSEEAEPHVLTVNELLNAYTQITGGQYTDTPEVFKTDNVKSVAEGNGKTWSNNLNDLLGIGMPHYLGGTKECSVCLWFVTNMGTVSYGAGALNNGVRICLTLKAGTTIDTTDTTRDGSTLAKEYILK